MIIVSLQRTDFEGYNKGRDYDKVGPFDTMEEAVRWVDSHPQYKILLYGYGHVRYTDMSVEVTSPDDWKPRR